MLFAVDVGNTNLTLGVHRNGGWAGRWRLKTDPAQTVDGWGVLFRNLFTLTDLNFVDVRGIIISSVVPQLDSSLEEMAKTYFRTTPLFVSAATDTGLVLRVDNPTEVGADRIVNGVSAFQRYGGPCIVVDFGTAITFDAISGKGEYVGGAICAGIGISSEALFRRTARLPHIQIRDPKNVIGKNTVANLQSGLYYGTLGMVEGILGRMKKELGTKTKIIATGGQASVVCRGCPSVNEIDDDLTLEGLRIIWERNSKVVGAKRPRRR
jgi:type III pantothenate kinase